MSVITIPPRGNNHSQKRAMAQTKQSPASEKFSTLQSTIDKSTHPETPENNQISKIPRQTRAQQHQPPGGETKTTSPQDTQFSRSALGPEDARARANFAGSPPPPPGPARPNERSARFELNLRFIFARYITSSPGQRCSRAAVELHSLRETESRPDPPCLW